MEIALLSDPSRSNRCRRKEPIRFAVRGFSPSQLVFGAWDAPFRRREGLEQAERRHLGLEARQMGVVVYRNMEDGGR